MAAEAIVDRRYASIENIVHYLGVDIDDAITISERTEI
jgi:hypothetical protein